MVVLDVLLTDSLLYKEKEKKAGERENEKYEWIREVSAKAIKRGVFIILQCNIRIN